MANLENIYSELKAANRMVEVKTLSRGMRFEKAIEGGWEYTFFFDHDKLTKVEAFNGREFIEQYNK